MLLFDIFCLIDITKSKIIFIGEIRNQVNCKLIASVYLQVDILLA